MKSNAVSMNGHIYDLLDALNHCKITNTSHLSHRLFKMNLKRILQGFVSNIPHPLSPDHILNLANEDIVALNLLQLHYFSQGSIRLKSGW